MRDAVTTYDTGLGLVSRFMASKLAALGRRASRRFLSGWIAHWDLVILRKPLGAPPVPPPGYQLREQPVFDRAVVELHRQLGRDHDESQIRRRFDYGLRFFVLWQGERVAATIWVVPRGERFVDEIGLGFPVGDGDIWMRDIFVAPSARGQGVFSALLDHVLAGPCGGGRALWSAVGTPNRPSLRAHGKYGHVAVARYEVVHILGSVMLRLHWPGPLPNGSSFAADRRLVLTGSRYRDFVDARRA